MTENLTKMRMVIVEDDPVLGLALQKLLANFFPAINVVSVSENVEQAKASIIQENPDIILLDVELPNNKNAFDLLRESEGVSPQIILMTAFPQRGIPPMLVKHSIVDFLTKPIEIPLLKKAINKAVTRIIDQQLLSAYKQQVAESDLAEQLSSSYENTLTLPLTKGRLIKLELDQILRCESNGDLTNLYFEDPTKEKLVLVKSLKECENSFRPDLFCRIHKQHLVNLKFVDKIHLRGLLEVELKNGERIPIARRRKKKIIERFRKVKSEGRGVDA